MDRMPGRGTGRADIGTLENERKIGWRPVLA
jgi:hypothetical protein